MIQSVSLNPTTRATRSRTWSADVHVKLDTIQTSQITFYNHFKSPSLTGNCGVSVDLPSPTSADAHGPLATLFAEELGLIIEVSKAKKDTVLAMFASHNVPATVVGHVTSAPNVAVSVAGVSQITGGTAALRDVWEETSFALERLQSAAECVDAEQNGLKDQKAPKWVLPFTPAFTSADKMASTNKVRVFALGKVGTTVLVWWCVMVLVIHILSWKQGWLWVLACICVCMLVSGCGLLWSLDDLVGSQ